MDARTNTASTQKSNGLRKKLLFRPAEQTIDKENDIKPKSFKKSCRNALNRWKRKITKIRRLLFRHIISSETTSNEIQTPSLSHSLTSDLSPLIISDDETSNQLLTTNKNNNITESSESDDLVKLMDEIIACDDTTLNHATCNNFLARADKLIHQMIARDDTALNDLRARADKLKEAISLLFHLNILENDWLYIRI